MKLETTCQTTEQFWSGNGQDIREAILRQAVKSCEHYATDVLHFFDCVELANFLENKTGSITIWFRAMGVDWCEQQPDKYRYYMELVKCGTQYTLTGRPGNC